jgi:hypothetical protein
MITTAEGMGLWHPLPSGGLEGRAPHHLTK